MNYQTNNYLHKCLNISKHSWPMFSAKQKKTTNLDQIVYEINLNLVSGKKRTGRRHK